MATTSKLSFEAAKPDQVKFINTESGKDVEYWLKNDGKLYDVKGPVTDTAIQSKISKAVIADIEANKGKLPKEVGTFLSKDISKLNLKGLGAETKKVENLEKIYASLGKVSAAVTTKEHDKIAIEMLKNPEVQTHFGKELDTELRNLKFDFVKLEDFKELKKESKRLFEASTLDKNAIRKLFTKHYGNKTDLINLTDEQLNAFHKKGVTDIGDLCNEIRTEVEKGISEGVTGAKDSLSKVDDLVTKLAAEAKEAKPNAANIKQYQTELATAKAELFKHTKGEYGAQVSKQLKEAEPEMLKRVTESQKDLATHFESVIKSTAKSTEAAAEKPGFWKSLIGFFVHNDHTIAKKVAKAGSDSKALEAVEKLKAGDIRWGNVGIGAAVVTGLYLVATAFRGPKTQEAMMGRDQQQNAGLAV